MLVLAGISLGMTLHTTHAAEWISVLLLRGIGSLSPFMGILIVVLLVSLCRLCITNNNGAFDIREVPKSSV